MRLTEIALSLPVTVGGRRARTRRQRLTPEQHEQTIVAYGIGLDPMTRVDLERVEDSVLEQPLLVVRQKRLQGLGARLVLADMKNDRGF